MYITSIKIENLRCFEQTELTFQYPGRETETSPRLPNVNLLLGDNGTGKTTTLKAIALAALAPIITQSGFRPYRLVRRTGKSVISTYKTEIEGRWVFHHQDLGPEIELTDVLYASMGIYINRNADYEHIDPYYPTRSPYDPPKFDKMYNDSSPAFLMVGYGTTRRSEDSENLDLTARRKARLLRYERVAGLFENYISLIPLAS